mgnify:CR=1 FL=1
MTNREKYAKELLDIACGGTPIAVKNGVPCACDGTIRCDECDLHDDYNCGANTTKWCNSEYIEPAIDWPKVPVDTPILVRDLETSMWYRRHFTKYKNGKVYAFDNGGTSWSGSYAASWNHAKLATDDELNANSILRANRREAE